MNELRLLPSVDQLLQAEEIKGCIEAYGRPLTLQAVREVLAAIRERHAHTPAVPERGQLLFLVKDKLASWTEPALQGVINATGVILHTNLGRAPLSQAAMQAVQDTAQVYSNLEYDLPSGKRGSRAVHARELWTRLTQTESALVVNNNAAAVLLVLYALARRRKVVIARSQLVEIGGGFRVPDVMAQSGTRMVEVGTTNRTKLRDYEQALTPDTRLLMRVHPSNYRVVGFTAAPELAELATLAHARGLFLYEDAGSGALIDLRPLGLAGEPVIAASIAAGADVVTFSGDKLLGGAQAGCVAGRREVVEKLRKHPLYRALRADKLILAALEATLESYRRGAARDEIPVLQMLSATAEELRARAETFLARLPANGAVHCEIVAGHSAVGGGAAPLTQPATALLSLTHNNLSAGELEAALRAGDPPVVARVAEGRVLLDLRTVAPEEEDELRQILTELA
jgi:L-seryl-tRNA(Ser) seleniumtransferase